MSTVVEATGLDLAGYLAAVRRELADLGTDEVDELTGGLEADLADALESSGAQPEELFGPPAAYAAELRTAAGLPVRAPAAGPRWSVPGIRRRGAELRERLTRQSWWPEVRAFAVACRPLWWVFRGYVVYQLVIQTVVSTQKLLPDNPVGWVLLALLAGLSIQAGQRDWGSGSRTRRMVIAAWDLLAIFAVLLAVWLLTVVWDSRGGLLPVRAAWSGDQQMTTAAYSAPEGLVNNGNLVRNIFPYDADGNPLEGVQLYDDRGSLLEPSEKDYDATNYDNEDGSYSYVTLVPALGSDGQARYNVYPLKERVEDGLLDADGDPVPGSIRVPQPPARMQYPVVPLPTPRMTEMPAAQTTSEPPDPAPTEGG